MMARDYSPQIGLGMYYWYLVWNSTTVRGGLLDYWTTGLTAPVSGGVGRKTR